MAEETNGATQSAILGTWRFESVSVPGEMDFMHFTPSRVLHAILDRDGQRRQPMFLWYKMSEPGVIHVRGRPGREPWISRMRMDGPCLLLLGNRYVHRCFRVPEEDTPDWFVEFLQKQNLRMDEIEKRATESEPDGDT